MRKLLVAGVVLIVGCSGSSHKAPSTAITSTVCDLGSACAQADGLFNAWRGGDRSSAARYATPEVVTVLFSHPSDAQDVWRSSGCTGAAGSSICVYDAPRKEVQMQVNNGTGGGAIQVVSAKWLEGTPPTEAP